MDWGVRQPLTIKERLIHGLIPEIECPSGCDLCCQKTLSAENTEKGVRNFSRQFPYMQYEHDGLRYIEGVADNTCHQHVGFGCKIYESRPLVCRMWWK